MAENIFHRSFQNIFSSALKGTIINDDMQIWGAPKHTTPSRLQAYPEHKCSHQYHSRGHVRLQTIGIGYWDADFVTQVLIVLERDRGNRGK